MASLMVADSVWNAEGRGKSLFGSITGVPVGVPGRLRVEKIVEGWKTLRVLVVGDIMLDRFSMVSFDGYDLKDNSPVYVYLDDPYSESFNSYDSLGGAGNLGENVNGLSGVRVPVTICGMVGNDEYGRRLLELCNGRDMRAKVCTDMDLRTTMRDYIVCREECSVDGESTESAESTESTKSGNGVYREYRNRTVMRMDYDSRDDLRDLDEGCYPFQMELDDYLLEMERGKGGLDGIILSDYCMGVVNRETVGRIARFMETDVGRDLRVVVDTRSRDLSKYECFFHVDRSVSERVVLLGSDRWLIGDDKRKRCESDEDLAQSFLCGFVDGVRERFQFDGVYLTRGGMPAFLSDRGKSGVIDMIGAYNVDVENAVGAGDSSTAGFSLSYFSGCDLVECANISQMCGAISASCSGISVVTDRLLDGFASTVLKYSSAVGSSVELDRSELVV